MGRWNPHVSVAGLVLVFLGSCSSQSLPGSTPHPALRAGQPVAPALLGLALGPGQALPACAGQAEPAQACSEPVAKGSDMHTVQLAALARMDGVHRRASALQLGNALESISVQIDGAPALQALPGVLDQLCGPPSFDSRMQLDGGGQLWSMAWQCSDGMVQLNAVQHEAMAQAALSVTTERGQQWFEGGDSLALAD